MWSPSPTPTHPTVPTSLSATSPQFWNTSMDSDPPPLGSTTPSEKKFFLISNLNLPWSNFRHSLSSHLWKKSQAVNKTKDTHIHQPHSYPGWFSKTFPAIRCHCCFSLCKILLLATKGKGETGQIPSLCKDPLHFWPNDEHFRNFWGPKPKELAAIIMCLSAIPRNNRLSVLSANR